MMSKNIRGRKTDRQALHYGNINGVKRTFIKCHEKFIGNHPQKI